MSEKLVLKCKPIDSEAIKPTWATEGAACIDLHCTHGGIIEAGQEKIFETGLTFEIPPGYALMVYSRSGHGFKQGLRLVNCVGVIDSDYRGEVKIKLYNDSKKQQLVSSFERIAQAMLIEVPKFSIELVDELGLTERGEGGLGSTGK